jgi:nucleoside phosphorylase
MRLPELAILTALDCELAAVTAVLDDLQVIGGSVPGDPNPYTFGTLPSRDPVNPHPVVITVLPEDGTRSTAAAATDLLRTFPSVRCVIFCGIAGGVPGPESSGIRLGDVVVADEGVVDYDHTRTVNGTMELRRHVRSPSSDLKRACLALRASHADLSAALELEIHRVMASRFERPPASFDRFADAAVQVPRVHWGWVGSADRHLSDGRLRDELAARHGIRAVEMEAVGLAAAAGIRGRDWFVVRGISDYADDIGRNYLWHPYAALTAAAFTRLLLRYCRRLGGRTVPPQGRLQVEPTRTTQLAHLLMAVPSWLDPSVRRAVVDELPRQIGGVVSQTSAPFLETRDLIRTCLDYAEGPSRLLAALHDIVGPTTSLQAFESALREAPGTADEWPAR